MRTETSELVFADATYAGLSPRSLVCLYASDHLVNRALVL